MRSRCKEVVSSSSHDLSSLVDESEGVVIPWLANHDMVNWFMWILQTKSGGAVSMVHLFFSFHLTSHLYIKAMTCRTPTRGVSRGFLTRPAIFYKLFVC